MQHRNFRILNKIVGTIFLLCVLQISLSCSKKSDLSEADQKLAKATRLVDQRDYDGAIELCQSVLNAESNERATRILASAFSGKAGIHVEDYWGFVIGYEGLVGPDQKAIDIPLGGLRLFAASSKDLEGQAKSLKILLDQIVAIQKRIEKIPYLESSKRVHLHQAIEALTKSSTRGGRLYRAILSIILVRSGLEDSQKFLTELSIRQNKLCSQTSLADDSSILLMSMNLVNSLGLFIESLKDLSAAFPDGLKDLRSYMPELGIAEMTLRQQTFPIGRCQ